MKKQSTLSHDELAVLCHELYMLIDAGEEPGPALKILAEESDPEYKDMLMDMAKKIVFGANLSAAMKETERFPGYVCELVKMGEKSGHTKEALESLSEYYEGRARMDRRVRSALLYPAVMLLLMLVVIAVLLVRVLPIFDDVYASLGGQLTGVAGGLLALGRGLDKAMPVLWVLLAGVVVFLAVFSAVPSFREKLTASWQRIHGDKGLSRKMNDACLAQALAMGIAGDLETREAVKLAAGLVENIPQAKERCEGCYARLLQGEKESTAMQESGLLPASACRMLQIGQRSGMRKEAMAKIAANLEEESESALEETVSRVEPALVLVCSILVGLILLSVMLPLMHIMSAIG